MTTDSFKVSVIIPAYNAEKYISKCLESIINQNYNNIEVVIIDDGSNDMTYAICKKYADIDGRILLIHQENHGLVYSRYEGIRNSTGDYLLFVDADDYIDLDAIQNLLRMAPKYSPDIVAYGLVEEYSTHTVVKTNNFCEKLYDRNMLEKEVFPYMLSKGEFFKFGILPNMVCKLIKKSFWNECIVNVSDNISVGEDADFSFQLIGQAKQVYLSNYCPYHYCKREDSMMGRQLGLSAIETLRDDLEQAFTRFDMLNIMSRQIDEYITFVKLLKNPQSVIQVKKIFDDNMKKCALYGAGGFGQAVYEQYSSHICLWVDQNYERYKSLKTEIEPYTELLNGKEYDFIFVAILNTEICIQVRNKLQALGINKEIYFITKNSV